MLEFVGQPNIAMLIAAGFSIFTYARQMLRNQPELKGKLAKALSEKLESPLATAGVIILITGAGGAFGGMIRLAGVGEAIEGLAEKFSLNYILLAWVATAVVRIAQGSATDSHDYRRGADVRGDRRWQWTALSSALCFPRDWVWLHHPVVDE